MPSAAHLRQEGAALPVAGTQRSQHNRLRRGDVCVGCIVWLPPRKSHDDPVLCNRHDCCGSVALEAEGYDHPVVVLKIRQSINSNILGDLVCTIACATTFTNTSLDVYRAKRRRNPHYQASLPIFNATPESTKDDPGTMHKLFLEKGNMRKQSYVRLEHTYDVPLSMLTQYSGGRAYITRLSEASYTTLMKDLGLVPEIFEITATLSKTRQQRLSALANAATPSQNATRLPCAAETPQQLVFPPIYHHSPTHVSQPTLPTSRYGATSLSQAPMYVPPSYPDALPYSSSAEPSDPGSTSLVLKYIFGVAVVGSLVWWRYSRP